jgi:hypothetical protein
MPEFPKEISMLREKIIRAPFMWACVLAMLSLLSTVAYAQKGMQTTEGAPLKGVDVKLGKNPGGGRAARTIRADENGKFNLGVLEKGSWYLEVVVPASAAATAQSDDVYVVTLNGAVGGEEKWEWSIKPPADGNFTRRCDRAKDYLTRSDAESRVTKPIPQKTIIFNMDGAHPFNGTIVKSKSNITNNRTEP